MTLCSRPPGHEGSRQSCGASCLLAQEPPPECELFPLPKGGDQAGWCSEAPVEGDPQTTRADDRLVKPHGGQPAGWPGLNQGLPSLW